jgi:agmatinase
MKAMPDWGAFGALPEKYCSPKKSRVAILPVAYDGTSTWQKGADAGPAALLEASANMELFDIETDSEVYRQGIVCFPQMEGFASPDEMVQKVYEQADEIFAGGKFFVGLGGEHSVSFPMVKGAANHISGLSVLQLDAHSDLRPEYEGSRYNHACVMSRISEICPFVQAGIRSMDISERQYIDSERIFYAHQMKGASFQPEMLLPGLSENVYITIDLDVFDPAIMPATGTPEPGGLDWYEVIRILEVVTAQRTVVGFDVVELMPSSHHKASAFLAAKLVYRLLSIIFKKKEKERL